MRLHTCVRMGSTNWTRGSSQQNKNYKGDIKLGGRCVEDTGTQREAVVDRFDQYTLYKCVKLPKNKNIIEKMRRIRS